MKEDVVMENEENKDGKLMFRILYHRVTVALEKAVLAAAALAKELAGRKSTQTAH